ncbi:MAG: polysaccharide deacetylase family protein [Bacteroidetes bacterium]|nr:polysaccharide deacetylase family protein [Bacteroidota bacterium]
MKILSFDIEDWFHINFDKNFNIESKWDSFDSRLELNTKKILELLSEKGIKATFFCLGWVARKYPHIIREFQKAGHDIGSHSDVHNLVSLMTPEEFNLDLKKSLESIENVIGKKVKMFRAPAFSIGKENLWAFDILKENGIEIDASIFPANHDFGGFPEISFNNPFLLNYNGNKIKEFPVSTMNILTKRIVISGGGFFRFFPYGIIKGHLKRNSYSMTYFHPRDIDSMQPMLDGLSLIRRFKSYYGIKKALSKFKTMLNQFEFMSVSEADKIIDWKSKEIIELT